MRELNDLFACLEAVVRCGVFVGRGGVATLLGATGAILPLGAWKRFAGQYHDFGQTVLPLQEHGRRRRSSAYARYKSWGRANRSRRANERVAILFSKFFHFQR